MAKQSKKRMTRVIRDLEMVLGPIGPQPDSANDGPALVAVFGVPNGATGTEVLGLGQLVLDDLVLAKMDTVAALTAGARATTVGFAWVAGGQPRSQMRAVANFGHRETDDPAGLDMWAIELASPSTAPVDSGMPPGSSPANGFCFFFPWLAMCKTK